jgi:hypothetical protein
MKNFSTTYSLLLLKVTKSGRIASAGQAAQWKQNMTKQILIGEFQAKKQLESVGFCENGDQHFHKTTLFTSVTTT